MRALRTRRRDGLHGVRIFLHETEIDSLIEKGFLKKERRNAWAVYWPFGAWLKLPLGMCVFRDLPKDKSSRSQEHETDE
jgi:hypothetical protein